MSSGGLILILGAVLGVCVTVILVGVAYHALVKRNRGSIGGATTPRSTKYNQFSNSVFSVEDNSNSNETSMSDERDNETDV